VNGTALKQAQSANAIVDTMSATVSYTDLDELFADLESMRKTKYTVKPITQFKKDYKLAMKRGLKINLLEDVIAAHAMGDAHPVPAFRRLSSRFLWP